MAGRNRSGLVCSIAMADVVGVSASEAGRAVRTVRLGALTNMAFRGLLSRIVQADVKSCELCAAEVVTTRHHEDGICWIADCKQCLVPMVVYREHGVVPPKRHLDHMVELLFMCGKPGKQYRIESERRTIPDHWHAHLRPL